jgi:hypothetical protein
MKPYGMDRRAHADDDAAGCSSNGRATGVYSIAGRGGDARAYRSLRGGKKAARRRLLKRRARRECRVDIEAESK